MSWFIHKFLIALIFIIIIAGTSAHAGAISEAHQEFTGKFVLSESYSESITLHNLSQNVAADIVYADNSNFNTVMQNGTGHKIILTESIVLDAAGGEIENGIISTKAPIDVEMGEYSIIIKEGSRFTFEGPYHFSGAQTLFHIEGEIFFNDVELKANGNNISAITFSNAPIHEGEYTMGLEMNNSSLSLFGENTVGFHAVQGANIRLTNSVITCSGAYNTGIIDEQGSNAAIWLQSRFDVAGENAVGMVLERNSYTSAIREFNMTVSGENSRGIVVMDGGICTNSGMINVSGINAVGIYLEYGAKKIKSGAVEVFGQKSTGVAAEKDMEALQLSLSAEDGIAARSNGALDFILCNIEADSDRLISDIGKITMDTCRIREVPEGAVIKTRKAQPYLNSYETPDGDILSYDVGTFGLSIPSGSPKLILPDDLVFTLYDPEDISKEAVSMPLLVIWKNTEYDPDIAGDYEITYGADTNDIPIEVSGSIKIHVYDIGSPMLLYALRLGDTHTELYFTPKTEVAENIRLWVSSDYGDTWFDYIEDGRAEVWGRLGFITTDELEENMQYLIKLEIDGKASSVISYWRNEREIKWSNGDRDGGDQRPNKGHPDTGVPSEPMPSPGNPDSPVKEKDQKEKPVFAANGEGSENLEQGIVITGPELANILEANPKGVTIIQNGIKADIPADVLKSIGSNQHDSLTVVLEQPDKDSFSLQMYTEEKEIGLSSDAPAEITVSSSGTATLAVPRDGGEPVPEKKTHDGETTFSIPNTGTYDIEPFPADQEKDDASEKKTGTLNRNLIFAAVVFGVILLIAFAVSRNRGETK